jgi:splicing factor 3A subunit 2
MDFQNRVGVKAGSGAPASASDLERARKERLHRLQIETTDLSNDPYILRNHLGTFECRLCLTQHSNENSYLAHTTGKKHQTNLHRRQLREQRENQMNLPH